MSKLNSKKINELKNTFLNKYFILILNIIVSVIFYIYVSSQSCAGSLFCFNGIILAFLIIFISPILSFIQLLFLDLEIEKLFYRNLINSIPQILFIIYVVLNSYINVGDFRFLFDPLLVWGTLYFLFAPVIFSLMVREIYFIVIEGLQKLKIKKNE